MSECDNKGSGETSRPARAFPRLSHPNRIGKAERRRRNAATSHRREADEFYHSPEWKTLRLRKLWHSPWCEMCLEAETLTAATVVHHKIEIAEDRGKALDLDNLMSVCVSCHSKHHAARQPRGRGRFSGPLDPPARR